MATLLKRASASQYRMIRIIEGAVKNSIDAHPEWSIDPRFSSSIAKRAVGTLSAQWTETLAAEMPSERALVKPLEGHARSGLLAGRIRKGSVTPCYRRSPLRKVWKELSWRAGEARKNGQPERYVAFVEMLRVVGAMMEKT